MEQLGSEILFFNDLKEDNNALMLGRDKHLHYWCLIMVIESVHNTLSLRFSILHVPVFLLFLLFILLALHMDGHLDTS